MRSPATLEWEIPEIEETEWQDLVLPEHRTVSSCNARRDVLRVIAIISLGPLLVLVASSFLWLKAQHGLARIEQEMGTLVAVEAVRRTSKSGIAEHAQIEAIDLDASGAMVQVVVTKTAEGGDIVQHETQFYTRVGRGWQRSVPLISFWGEPSALDTDHIHFEYCALDEPVVRAIAPDAETHLAGLLATVGLDSVSAAERITIEITPATASRQPPIVAEKIVLASPAIQPFRTDEAPESRLLGQICAAMGALAYDELMERATVLPAWKPLVGYLYHWLDNPQRGLAVSPLSARHPLSCTADETRAPLYELTSDPRRPYPGALLVASDADRRQNGMAFIDFVVAWRGQEGIPALLHATGRCADWEELADEVFGLPLEEVETRFGCYLRAHEAETLAPAQATTTFILTAPA